MDATAAPVAARQAMRKLGRFDLLQLLGRSARSMAWRVVDPRSGQQRVLVLPRRQPPDNAALQSWLDRSRRAARLAHPNLAVAVEVGEQERWPYVAYDGAIGSALSERPAAPEGEAAAEVAQWMVQALAGLAFAHDAGVAHHDVQPFLLCLADNGALRVLGLEVAVDDAALAAQVPPSDKPLGQSRDAAERDVLGLAIVMHGLLVGTAALGDADTGAVIDRLAPIGREFLRLPWDLPRPVPDVVRAIVNRATDRQPRLRYRSARTLARALEGWLESDAQQGQDPHAELIDRVRQIGALPALPGAAARAARLALMDREHSEELAHVALRDPALSFELLRSVNSAQVRGTQVSGNGPVLTVRRAIAMIGLDGVRRCALGLRQWPGPLDDNGARDLEHAIALAQRAARVAQALRPPGYDAEVVSLVALMQNLGRLVVRYHFADEMRQVHRLMQSAPVAPPVDAAAPATPAQSGMSEQAAAFAVLGADIEAMGAAVARWWGMDDAVLHMIRRLPSNLPVRHADTDDDMLRTVASLANEAVDVLSLPAAEQAAALEHLVQRYHRVLGCTLRDLQTALQVGVAAGDGGIDVADMAASA